MPKERVSKKSASVSVYNLKMLIILITDEVLGLWIQFNNHYCIDRMSSLTFKDLPSL